MSSLKRKYLASSALFMHAALVFSMALASTLSAQTSPVSVDPYLNPTLPADVRAKDLVSRLTLEQKASQLVNQSRAISRLKIPAYNWWSEALHGVAVDGTTEFPEPIGLGATFDVPLIHKMAEAISTEARVVHNIAARGGDSPIFHGLDFWAPNVNIFRDPRWGRGQETYGEDPFLTARLGVAFVTGMQGDDPLHYRVIATPKHFAVHSGPEPTRHIADVDVSRHDQVDTYEPAFRAAIVEGKAGSVMCSYNAINGQPACASEYLLRELLRDTWGFEGYVVSDCGAVRDIFSGHHYRASQAQSSAISLERGMDNECFDYATVKDDHDYKPYVEAAQKGYLSQATMDSALVRLFTARFKLGMFDPPKDQLYEKIGQNELNSVAHRTLARKIAEESMVLLKNDGVLPLTPTTRKILVVGPLAAQTAVLLGNYNGTPTHTVSMLEGLKHEFPGAKLTYIPGTQFLGQEGKPIPNNLLTTSDGAQGLLATYTLGEGGAPGPNNKSQAITSRVEPNIDVNGKTLPSSLRERKFIEAQWTGFLTAEATGDYLIGLQASGFANVSVDGKTIALQYGSQGVETKLGRVHLQKQEKVAIDVQYRSPDAASFNAKLLWAPVDDAPSPEVVSAARDADLVIAAVGLTSRLEGEEMPVSQPGFLGGDRTSIDLPQPEEALVEAVAAAGKPLVVVLMNGSALGINWIDKHANAVLEAWYPGEEGGSAIASTLSGRNNPGGRLPVTFYKNVDQLPNFEDYSMTQRTYRYFSGKPLYPFGYGLSYTKFAYTDLTLPQTGARAGETTSVSVVVKNTGASAGDEVAELYLKFPPLPGAPKVALRGFQRVHLEPGQSRKLTFEMKARDLSMVTEAGVPIVASGSYTIFIGGGQPESGASGTSGHFNVAEQLTLTE